MTDNTPDTAAIVSAFAARAGLQLSPDELAKLCEFAVDSWDMADQLRSVTSPGLEGRTNDLPLRAGWSNQPEPIPAPSAPRQSLTDPKTIDPSVLEGSLIDAANRLAAGEFTPVDLVAAQLQRIREHDGQVRSYISIDEEGSLRAAEQLTRELAESGPRSPLHGIPIGAKDSIPATGMPCTYNSPLTQDWHPKRDAEAIRRLRAGGAILIGKHNLNEFGWSIPGEDDLTPPPRNPWLPEEYSVGSTSGGGAAVAARLAMGALGTDGGGSARLPGGQHLLFGLKPGHGMVPTQGVSEGLVSEVSVLTRTAEDAAALLSVLLVTPDSPDSYRRLQTEPYAHIALVRSEPKPLRIAVPQGYLDSVGMEEDVREAMEATYALLQDLGHEVVQLPAPVLDILHDGVRANFIVIAAQHYFDHEGPGKDRSRYGSSAGFYNLPGACLSAADYMHALRVGNLVRDAVDSILVDYDMLLTPTSPVTRSSTARNPKTHRRGGNAAYTSPFNISGHPALSVPVKLSHEGMPIGIQLVGPSASEFRLLQLGRSLAEGADLPAYPDLRRMARVIGD